MLMMLAVWGPGRMSEGDCEVKVKHGENEKN